MRALEIEKVKMKLAEQYIDELIHQQALPAHYKDLTGDYLWPLVQDMHAHYQALHSEKFSTRPWLVGLQGTQGSGKSTVCLFIKALLEQCFNYSVAIFSLDDFYLTKQERNNLAETVHPLLITRGVPGTHDVDLALTTFKALEGSDVQSLKAPSFSKAIDDRRPKSEWPMIDKPVDIILFEGWCVGATPQTDRQLEQPINLLEKKEDTEGVWRRYVNDNLKGNYKALFEAIDNLIVLEAPSFKQVYEWRLLQETKLSEGLKPEDDDSNILSADDIRRFISHYERLTNHCLAVLPQLASWVLTLNEHHDMVKLTRNNNEVRLE